MDIVKNKLQYYVPTVRYVKSFEESVTAIVPDTQHDMLCVSSCRGSIEVQERSFAKGSVIITGAVNCLIVYSPVEGDHPEVIEITIPFTYNDDFKGMGTHDRIIINAKLISVTASMVNPRKVSVKARIEVSGRVYEFKSNDYIEDIASNKDEGINFLASREKIRPICSITEKRIVINDEIDIEGREPNSSSCILSQENKWINEDVKVLPNKIMIRGRIDTEIGVVSDDGGRFGKNRYSIPFSQIVECEGLSAEDEVEIAYIPSREDIKIFTGSDGSSNLEISFAAQTVCVVRRELELLTVKDIFSTFYDLNADRLDLSPLKNRDESVTEKEINEKIILENHPSRVIHASALCERVQGRKNEKAAEAVIYLHIIYADEDNMIYSEFKRVCAEISFNEYFEEDIWIEVKAVDASVTIGENGEAALLCTVKAYKEETTEKCSVLSNCVLDRGSRKDEEVRASIIMRRADRHESIWDIAKKYRVSPYAVSQANKADILDIPEQGKMLLIPMVR